MSLSDLLIGFFQYYSVFNYHNIVSVQLGKIIEEADHDELLSPESSEWKEKYVKIEEPFDGRSHSKSSS